MSLWIKYLLIAIGIDMGDANTKLLIDNMGNMLIAKENLCDDPKDMLLENGLKRMTSNYPFRRQMC